MNYFDLFCTTIILLSLYLLPKHKNFWLLYGFGCFCWMILMFTKQLYFGMIMNVIAVCISIKNWKK